MDGILFAYFGPESMLPVTSVIAACGGAFMIFGRGLVRFLRRSIRNGVTAHRGTTSIYRPHIRVTSRAPAQAEQSRT